MNVYESIVRGLTEAIEMEKQKQKQRENASYKEEKANSEKNGNNFKPNS